jgi:hypothetical protein
VALPKMHGQTNKDIEKNNELPCVIIKKIHFWREVAPYLQSRLDKKNKKCFFNAKP